MSLSASAVIYGLILVTFVLAIKRMREVRGMPAWTFLLLLVASAVPTYVAAKLLNPGEPIKVLRMARLHEKAELDLPEGTSLIVQGVLSDLDVIDDKKKSEAGKSNYRLTLTGEGWTQEATGEVRRKTDRATAAPTGGAALKDTRSRAAQLGEDLEQRFDLKGHGHVGVEVNLWQGAAIDAVLVQVVPAPPPRQILWIVAGVLTVLGLYAEVRLKAVQLGGDVAFLTVFGIFMLEQITPASGFQEAGVAAFGAALLGWLAVGGLAWLLLKLDARRASA